MHPRATPGRAVRVPGASCRDRPLRRRRRHNRSRVERGRIPGAGRERSERTVVLQR
jgi:hypothetical protein